jgi:hypothetical protein
VCLYSWVGLCTDNTVDSAYECVHTYVHSVQAPIMTSPMIQSFISEQQAGAGGRGVGRIIDLPDKITLLSSPSMGTVNVHSKKGDVKKEYCRKSALNKAGYLKVWTLTVKVKTEFITWHKMVFHSSRDGSLSNVNLK